MHHGHKSRSHNAKEELLRLLTECGREANARGSGSDTSIIPDPRPSPEALQLGANPLVRRRVYGPLFRDSFWSAVELRRHVAEERIKADRVESALNPLRFGVGRFTFKPAAVRLHGEKVKLPPEMAGALTPRVRIGAHVRERPHKFYGNLADPLTGGANALYAAGVEVARARRLAGDRVVLASPEALGFKLDTGRLSVVAWQKTSAIAVEAVGFTLTRTAHLSTFFANRQIDVDRDDLERKFAAWRAEGLGFAVGLALRGLKETPVVIPVGSVYQQPSIGSWEQNLAIAKSEYLMVAAGATVSLVLPAWCLNRRFSPPSGPLAPTPLMTTAAGGTQQEVWERTDRRHRAVLAFRRPPPWRRRGED